MRMGIVVMAALAAVGMLAFDGAAESIGAGGVFTGGAVAECTLDPVTNTCLPSCPLPDPERPLVWTCRL